MENRVTITICGAEYILVADETPSYMQQVASYVDSKMNQLCSSGKIGRNDAAVLSAVNIADELFKTQEVAENLRRQLKGYLDDANRAKSEASELRRELFKLQNRK